MTDNDQTRFCDACGAGLRPWDFLNGRAVMMGNRGFCAPCKPAPTATPPMPEPKGETRWRRQRNRQTL